MDIRLVLESQLRLAGGRSRTLDVPDGTSAATAVRMAAQQSGGDLTERLLDSDGALRRSVLLFVNGRQVRHESAGEFLLQPADEILLYPPQAGG